MSTDNEELDKFIRVKPSTHFKLLGVGNKGQTFDEIIVKLIEGADCNACIFKKEKK